MDRTQHLAWILADNHGPRSENVVCQHLFLFVFSNHLSNFQLDNSFAPDTLRSADGQSTASWPRPRSENVACQHFFCVHSATLDQKNLVHIYPRTYLQLYIST